MRVTFVKFIINTPSNTRLLWRVEENKTAATFATHVVTSSVDTVIARETMAFWANAAGRVVSWDGLATEAPNEHVACLKAAGFEVVV